MTNRIYQAPGRYRAGTWLVIQDSDAVRIGLASAAGEAVRHERTADELRAVAAYSRLYSYQAEELAIEMGGAWIVDPDGEAYWQAPKNLPKVDL